MAARTPMRVLALAVGSSTPLFAVSLQNSDGVCIQYGFQRKMDLGQLRDALCVRLVWGSSPTPSNPHLAGIFSPL